MKQKLFNYLYKTKNGRDLLHVIIGAFISLGCVIAFEMDGYKPFYVVALVTIIGFIWELYHWKFNKAVFDKGDIFRASFGALIVLLITKIINNI